MQKKIDALKKLLGGMNGGNKGEIPESPIKATIVAKNPEGLKEGAEKLEETAEVLEEAQEQKFSREELLEKFKKMLDPSGSDEG